MAGDEEDGASKRAYMARFRDGVPDAPLRVNSVLLAKVAAAPICHKTKPPLSEDEEGRRCPSTNRAGVKQCSATGPFNSKALLLLRAVRAVRAGHRFRAGRAAASTSSSAAFASAFACALASTLACALLGCAFASALTCALLGCAFASALACALLGCALASALACALLRRRSFQRRLTRTLFSRRFLCG
jgi:hypothetical protein